MRMTANWYSVNLFDFKKSFIDVIASIDNEHKGEQITYMPCTLEPSGIFICPMVRYRFIEYREQWHRLSIAANNLLDRDTLNQCVFGEDGDNDRLANEITSEVLLVVVNEYSDDSDNLAEFNSQVYKYTADVLKNGFFVNYAIDIAGIAIVECREDYIRELLI